MNGGTEGSGGGSGTGATKTKATAAPTAQESWTLETGTGSMTARTALDVLNDVRAKVATGELADFEAASARAS